MANTGLDFLSVNFYLCLVNAKGRAVKVCKGPFKGYRGRIVEFKGTNVRVELESQMKVVTGKSSSSKLFVLGFVLH